VSRGKVGLLDVNVLIALCWPTHVHHDVAHKWYRAHASQGWATCPLTQCAFVRISSNPKIIREAVSVGDAIDVLQAMTESANHVFWPDDLRVSDRSFPAKLIVGHRQVTDAYLLGLAVKHGGRLVTLDAGIEALVSPPAVPRGALELIASR